MTASLQRFGRAQLPLGVLDGFRGDPQAVLRTAAALAPFPEPEVGYDRWHNGRRV